MARRGENIYKRKDGRWEGRYKSGVKADGTARYSSIYGKTYAEVKGKLSEKRSKTDVSSIPKNLTVNNLFSFWFADIRLKVKESTYMNYQMKYEKHISSSLGKTPYEKLTVEKLNDFVHSKLASGLSAKYTADIAAVINQRAALPENVLVMRINQHLWQLPKARQKKKSCSIKRSRLGLTIILFLTRHHQMSVFYYLRQLVSV